MAAAKMADITSNGVNTHWKKFNLNFWKLFVEKLLVEKRRECALQKINLNFWKLLVENLLVEKRREYALQKINLNFWWKIWGRETRCGIEQLHLGKCKLW